MTYGTAQNHLQDEAVEHQQVIVVLVAVRDEHLDNHPSLATWSALLLYCFTPLRRRHHHHLKQARGERRNLLAFGVVAIGGD